MPDTLPIFIEVELSDGTRFRWATNEAQADEVLAAIVAVVGEPDTTIC